MDDTDHQGDGLDMLPVGLKRFIVWIGDWAGLSETMSKVSFLPLSFALLVKACFVVLFKSVL